MGINALKIIISRPDRIGFPIDANKSPMPRVALPATSDRKINRIFRKCLPGPANTQKTADPDKDQIQQPMAGEHRLSVYPPHSQSSPTHWKDTYATTE